MLRLEDPHRGDVHEGGREHAECPGFAGDLKLSGGEDVPGLVVEQVRGDTRGEPRPAHVLLVVSVLVQQCGQRTLESWGGCSAAVRESEAETVTEQIRGSR